MARPRKVYSGGKINWKNAAINASRSAAAKRKKREAEAARAAKKKERERIRLQRERERAAKKKERERIKLQRERERDAKRREVERNKKARADASLKKKAQAKLAKEHKAAEQKLKKERQLNEREQAKKDKHILRLNGLFLEHDLPMKFGTFDIKEYAYEYEIKNGLTTQSQFKKVTITYLDKNLFKKIENNLIKETSYEVESFLDENITKKFTSKQKNVLGEDIQKTANTYINEFTKLKIIKFPDEIISTKDLANIKPNQVLENSPNDFCKKNITKINTEVKNLKSLADQKIEEARIKAEKEAEKLRIQKEKDAKEKKKKEDEIKLATEALKKLESYLIKSRGLIKTINKEVGEFRNDLEELSQAHKKAFFKAKHIAKGKKLVQVIGNKTFPLFDEMIKLEAILRNIKTPDESKLIGKLVKNIKASSDISPKLDKLELAYKQNYKVIYKCGDQRLLNLIEACKYLEPEIRSSLISKLNARIESKYPDSNNIKKLQSRLKQIEESK